MDSLSTLRGRDYKINDNIIIRQPTIGEIEEFNENNYMSMVSTIVASPYDMIAQLDSMGIDFTKITAFQLFCTICVCLEQKNTSILFGDLDFTKFRQINNDGKIVLKYKDIIINEHDYNLIVDYVRKINMLSPPKFKSIANEYTKKKMIEYAYNDLELAKRRKPKSALKTLISRVTNHPYFKYKLDEIWDMKIYAFYDSISSIDIIENSNHLCMGAYSGNLDMSKINKNDFNWLREAE